MWFLQPTWPVLLGNLYQLGKLRPKCQIHPLICLEYNIVSLWKQQQAFVFNNNLLAKKEILLVASETLDYFLLYKKISRQIDNIHSLWWCKCSHSISNETALMISLFKDLLCDRGIFCNDGAISLKSVNGEWKMHHIFHTNNLSAKFGCTHPIPRTLFPRLDLIYNVRKVYCTKLNNH